MSSSLFHGFLSRLTRMTPVVLMPMPAGAHTGLHDQGGVLLGLLHPLLGVDHLLAMVAVGVLASRMQKGRMFWLPALFMAVMTFGAFLGVIAGPLLWVESMVAGSLVVFGGLLATRSLKMAPSVLMALVGLFAAFHGYAHGLEMTEGVTPIAYGTGFLLATAALHGLGILLDRTLFRSLLIARCFGAIMGGWGLFILLDAGLS